MPSNYLMRGLGSGLPFAGVMLVGVVAVTTAMTVLGWGAEPSVVPPSVVATTTPASTDPTPSASLPDIYPTVPVPSTSPRVIEEILKKRGLGGAWKVEFHYPQFVADTTPLAYLLNLDIKNEVETRVEAWVAGPAQTRQPGGPTDWLIGSYSVEMLSPRVASVILRWEDNSISKERPRASIQTINYALASARRIDLGEIFADQPGALNALSAESRTQLRTVLGDAYDSATVESGTAPMAANFTGWSLTPEGFKVTFDMYQVADWKKGLPVVVIPWARLASVLRADGPAAALAGLAPAAS